MKADISTETPIWLAVKIIAPKVGGATLADGSMLAADGQLVGMPSVLKIAAVERDAGVVDIKDKDAFIAAAKTRQWDRERSMRTLA